MKQKMSAEKKTKLIYSGELILIAIIFIVIATLQILNVIGHREVMLIIFNWITIFGGTWIIVDFFWVLFSPKRRKKNSLLDKAMLVPFAIYIIIFDIMCFAKPSFVTMEFRRLMMAIGFYYLAAAYIFQGIYHYFRPIPALIAAIEEEVRNAEKKKLEEQQAEENKEEEKKPE